MPSLYSQWLMEAFCHRRSRSNSMSYPPPPVAALQRTDSHGAQAPGKRPEWAKHYDPNRHEDAVTTTSVSME